MAATARGRIIAILVGPPGSGKGTIAPAVTKQFGLPHLSTGDMLRQAIAAKTSEGKKAHRYMQKGQLVPDALVSSIVGRRLKASDCRGGCLLDGFPRTLEQSIALDKMLQKSAGSHVTHVLELQVPDETLFTRICGRLVHVQSGRTYHKTLNPPRRAMCDDVTGEPLQQRDDDTEDALRKRLASYRQHTLPILAHYRARPSTTVRTIASAGATADVQQAAVRAIAPCSAILVTIDGVRADAMFAGSSTPFLQKQLRQSRATAQKSMRIENQINISYPGYSEMLTGRVDPAIRSNEYPENPNPTFLETAADDGLLDRQTDTLIATSWEKFPDIYALSRSQLRFLPAHVRSNTQRQRFARTVAPSFNASVAAFDLPTRESRDQHDLDAYYAFLQAHQQATRRGHPPLGMHLALGMTDWYAHQNNKTQFDNHLLLADSIIKHMWSNLDADFLVVTTDHGRGKGALWTSHGPTARFPGCDETWCIVLCHPQRYARMPLDIVDYVRTSCRRQSDIARLMRMLLCRAQPPVWHRLRASTRRSRRRRSPRCRSRRRSSSTK